MIHLLGFFLQLKDHSRGSLGLYQYLLVPIFLLTGILDCGLFHILRNEHDFVARRGSRDFQ